MSSVPKPMPPQSAEEQRRGSAQQSVTALMTRMGSKSGYDPLPPAQHKWQRAKGEPELHRFWSWMVAHTVGWGHRTEFATDANGNPLYIESAAADLGMDEANARGCWREGLRRGIWRNGTPSEGKRRMYLNGELQPQDIGDSPDKKVCTDLPPDYIWKQIKDWPPEKRAECLTEYKRNNRVEKDLLAEVVAVSRSICAQQLHDTWVQRWGLEKIRLDVKEKGEKEDIEARRDRRQQLSPILERFVQTFSESVQSQESIVYELEKQGVHIENGVATLLPAEKAREGQSGRAVSVNAAAATLTPFPSHDGKKSVQLHRPQVPATAASKSENEAVASFLTEYALMQLNHPEKFDGETVDPDDKGDRMATLKIVRAIGIQAMPDYLAYIANRVLGRNALGHRLKFGLVVDEWPQAFIRAAARDRETKEAEASQHRAAIERQRRQLQIEERIEQMVEQQWTTMADVGRSLRLIEAENTIKADKEKGRIWRGMTAEQKRELVETYARSALRSEIRKKEASRENA